MPRDPETPCSNLTERRRELVTVGGEASGVVVPCRQCGAEVELARDTLALINRLNARAKQQGIAPLRRSEVATCDRPDCREAEAEDLRRRSEREAEEVRLLLAAIRRGEAVTVPAEIVKYRPSCYARIQRALRARRDGQLPAVDKEIG